MHASFAVVHRQLQLTHGIGTDSAGLGLAEPILQFRRGTVDDGPIGSPPLGHIDGRPLAEARRIGQLDNGIIHCLNRIRDLGLRNDRLTADRQRRDAQRDEHEFFHCVSPLSGHCHQHKRC